MASFVDYANSEKQKRIAKLMDDGLSSRKIAKEMKMDSGYVRKVARDIRARARQKGYDPEHGINRPISDDSIMSLHAMSDMRKNEDGLPVWYKFSKDAEEVKRRIQAANEAFTKSLPKLPEIPATKKQDYDKDLIPWYQIGDAHIGMLARESDTGHSFDL